MKAQPQRPAQSRSLPAYPGVLEDCRHFPRAEGGGEDPLRGVSSAQVPTAVRRAPLPWGQKGAAGRSSLRRVGATGRFSGEPVTQVQRVLSRRLWG